MALMALAVVLSVACFFTASFIKRTHSPGPGSRLHITMQAAYFIGWGWAILVAILLLVLLVTTLRP